MRIESTGRRNSNRLSALCKCILLLAIGGTAAPAWATNYPVGCGATKATDLYNAINVAGSSSGGATVTLTAGCT
jgi:hypothetical protein